MTESILFRTLEDKVIYPRVLQTEEEEFRVWARENDPPKLEHWEIYHPICRDEWMKRGIRPPYEATGI